MQNTKIVLICIYIRDCNKVFNIKKKSQSSSRKQISLLIWLQQTFTALGIICSQFCRWICQLYFLSIKDSRKCIIPMCSKSKLIFINITFSFPFSSLSFSIISFFNFFSNKFPFFMQSCLFFLIFLNISFNLFQMFPYFSR